MKKLTRLQVIEFIITNSTSFKCEHITYTIENETINVQSSSKFQNFNATELITELTQFSQFLTVIDNKVVLKVY